MGSSKPLRNVERERDHKVKQYDRHQRGSVPMTVWVPVEYKDELKKEAEEAGVYRWSLSAHVIFLLDKARGKATRPYFPTQYAPSK